MIRLFTSSFLLLVLLLAGSPGRSDPQDNDARTAFAKGTEAYRDLAFSKALLYFKEAYRLRPSYRIQYNIAQTYLELSQPHLALTAFERYLSEGRHQIDAERRDEVVLEIRKLRQIVGEIVVTGKTGTECRVDDAHVGFLPLERPIRLEAGTHEISLYLHGEAVCVKKVQIIAGKKRIERCRLQDEDAQETPEPESAWDVMNDTTLMEYDLRLAGGPPAPGEKLRFIRVAPWVMTGLAAASLTTAAILAMKTSSLNAELSGACQNGECPPSRKSDLDRLPKLAAGADIMFVATSLFTAAAISLFIVGHKKSESPSTAIPQRQPRQLEEEISQRDIPVTRSKF